MKVSIAAVLFLSLCGVLPAQHHHHHGGIGGVTHLPGPAVPHIPTIYPVGGAFSRPSHRCYGPTPIWGVGYGFGSPYSYNSFGYGGIGLGGYYGSGFYSGVGPVGWGGVGYTSVSYGVPGFSVGYSAPLGGYSLGYSGLGYGGYGMGYTYAPVYTAPTPSLPALPQWVWDESGLRGTGAQPAAKTHPSLIPASAPEALLRSARLQDAGDRLFRKLDYFAAEKSYAKSLQAAPERPEPYLRLAMAKVARGDFRAGVNYIKQMVEFDSSYAGRAVSMGELFGDQNGIARLRFKQSVADWTSLDVHDPDRLLLLGVVLFLEGDDRFKTILDTAVKLEGQKGYLTAFLNAPPANAAPLVLPAGQQVEVPASDREPAEPTPANPAAPARPPLTIPVPAP